MILRTVLISIFGFFLILFQKERPVYLFMIGDSTMCNWTEEYRPETGWGQVLHEFFTGNIKVSNHARSGKSSKSFREQGYWQLVLDSICQGDYVMIQFGHNDSKTDSARFTDPKTSYKLNLVRYVEEVRSRKAFPILCTSIVRRRFNGKDQFFDTHGDYPDAVRQVARDLNVPLLDLQQKTAKLISGLGPEESKKIYLNTKPGEYPHWPDGVKDNTHLSPYGARQVAALAVEAITEQKLRLMDYLK